MTRLAEVKAQRDRAESYASISRICLQLALTSKPDHVERFREVGNVGRYVITAYGLTRADGGYVIVRFIHPNQTDTVAGYLFDDWRTGFSHGLKTDYPFLVAANAISIERSRLLTRESQHELAQAEI